MTPTVKPSMTPPLKRFLAVLLLMFGGFTTEAVKPFQCQLITATRPRRDPLPPSGN